MFTDAEIPGCRDSLPTLAQRGIELFGEGHYFEAHEELELAWRAEPRKIRDLYQGILQIGVGYYHILRKNYRGARKMIQRGRQNLEGFPAICQGVDLVQFKVDYEKVEQSLIRLGSHKVDQFDLSLLKPVPMKSSKDETHEQ